jgi:hypothetical protein
VNGRNKMQNHYIRSKNSSVDKLVNELESIVYNNIPDNELISEDKLMIFIENEIKKEYGSKKFSLKEIRSTIKNIVDKKIVKEVVGPKLSRFVYSQ